MLTKQEREEIAERFRNYDKAEYVTLYSGMYDGLLGEHVPKETTVKKDRIELASRILELCDTSNMLELPVDKNGEVIRPGDVVYGENNLRHEVYQIVFEDDGKWLVLVSGGRLCAALMKSKDVWSSPNMYDECLKDFDAAIGYYKRLVEKRSHE